MNRVSDAFLLELGGIAASLLGFFVVGVFFYVQRGLFPQAADQAQRYIEAATRSVIVLYGMTLLLSLALVVFATSWVSLLYLVLSLVLLWSVVRTSTAIRALHRFLHIRVMSQVGMWLAASIVIALPWVLGGIHPSRAHLTSAILAIGLLAFASSASLVLSAFDISRLEATAGREQRGAKGGPAESLAQEFVDPDAERQGHRDVGEDDEGIAANPVQGGSNGQRRRDSGRNRPADRPLQ